MAVPDALPPGMWFYSFMFGEARSKVSSFAEAGRLPPPSSLATGIGIGLLLTSFRLVLDIFVFKPLAKTILGLSESDRIGKPVQSLDAVCAMSKVLTAEQIADVVKSTDMSAEAVRDYARIKRERLLQQRQITKFSEAAWRLLVYSTLVWAALTLCYNESWFKDPYKVWDDWPSRSHVRRLETYYHVAMGVYWHFIVFQFMETRRSDFWQMLLHHVATLFLLTYSWLVSLVKIGTLIMLCHDVCDIFMETAKLFNYAQKRFPWCHVAADAIFFCFAAVFGVMRLYIYPKYMVLNVWQTNVLPQACRLFFCSLLTTLLVLHVFWFYLILRMIYMFVRHGVEEDIRSETGSDSDEHGTRTNGNGHSNGHQSGQEKKKA